MRLFGVGTATGSERVETAAAEHPSAPIPLVGPGVGECLRVALGATGIRVFPLMIGGAEFGWNTDTDSSHRILDRYVEFGGNAVHTADGFAAGRSEHIVGRWLRSRRRDDIVLGVRVGGHPDNPGLGSINLVRAVEASLTRLGVERIDVLYLDGAADQDAPLEDTLATAEWLVESGKVAALGAFGFSAERLVEARILSSAGYPRIDVLDEPYNLLRRAGFEGDLRLVAGAQGLAVTPSHALEHGFLSGRHRSKARALDGVRGQQLRSNINRRGIKALRALDLVAEELQVPVAAAAIAWLLAQRTITAPIVNAFSTEHVEELIQGAGVSLSRAQLGELSRAAA
ncbi:aldo/keto reductase [Microbacterium pseudoresistens]|uniref:Aryl-alcohol dehydrogenase-like predicted oxidoreductase n=1 Tax=Microbacterium pseudoresistens TaxID=640634 RepID=A0A7Y9EWC4_9MICO|nr:aldo/keto reductase [Microbacterium pseudoresistens]NYD55128.1 aryl-alcohol dehydrogenase-like predicted oxidoreductase [Microbacterium pseudoresistens]